MLKRIMNLGLRARFFLFLGAVLTPLVVLLSTSLTSDYRATIAAAKGDMRRMAETIAAQHSTSFREARMFLDTVRRLPGINAAGGPICSSLLADLKAAHPEFHTIGIVDAAQNVTCHSKLKKVQQFGDTAFFTRISQPNAADFNVSQFGIGKVSGQPTVVAALRLPSIDGTMRGFVFVGMSLTQLLQVDDLNVAEEQTMALIEMPSAKLLARYPALIGLFGTPMPEHPVVRAAMNEDRPSSGVAEGIGQDGQDRLFGYAWINGLGEAQILAAVGLPRAVALGGLHQRVFIAALVCCSVLTLSCIGAWWIGAWTQLQPIARLKKTAQRIALGDLEARAMVEPWQAPEFRELGLAFDEMATKLNQGRRAEQTLTERNRFLLIAERLAQVGYWQLDPSTMTSTWSDEIFRIYGIPITADPPPMEERVAAYHEDDQEKIRSSFRSAIEHGHRI